MFGYCFMQVAKPSLRSRPLIEVNAPCRESTLPFSPMALAMSLQAISPIPMLSARTIAATLPPSGPISIDTTGTFCWSAYASAGTTALLSLATTIRPLAPAEIRLRTSVFCLPESLSALVGESTLRPAACATETVVFCSTTSNCAVRNGAE